MFFEAQCGKTILDCHFSFVGIFLRRFARKIKSIKAPEDVYDVLIHGGGIENTSTHLVRFSHNDESDCADIAPREDVAVDNIRKIHDIFFEGNKVTTLNFSGVSKGKNCYDFTKDVPSTKDASLALSSRCERSSRSQPVNAEPEAPATGPSITFRSSATPHEMRISQAVIAFATASREIVPSILMSLEPIQGAESNKNVGSKSKKKVKLLDMEEFRATYETAWAESQQRKSPPMSKELEELLTKMVDLQFSQLFISRWPMIRYCSHIS